MLGSQQLDQITYFIEECHQNPQMTSTMRPELLTAFHWLEMEPNENAIQNFLMTLITEDFQTKGLIQSFSKTSLYSCFAFLKPYFSQDKKIFELLLANPNLDELSTFLESTFLPTILSQRDATELIEKILKDHKISDRGDLIEYCLNHELLSPSYLSKLFQIKHISLVKDFLIYQEQLDNLSAENFCKLLDLDHQDLFIDTYFHIPRRFHHEDAQNIFNTLQKFPYFRFILKIEFQESDSAKDFLELFSPICLEHIKSLQYSYLLNRITLQNALKLLQQPLSLLNQWISHPLAKKILNPKHLFFFLEHSVEPEKLEDIVKALLLLESYGLLADDKEFMSFLQFFMFYKKPFSLTSITTLILPNISEPTFSNYHRTFSFYENKYAIKEILQKISLEDVQYFPKHLITPLTAVLVSDVLTADNLYDLFIELVKTPIETLPITLQIFSKCHGLECLKSLQNASYLNSALLYQLLLNQTSYLLPQGLITLNKFEEMLDFEGDAHFKNEHSLLKSSMLVNMIEKISRFDFPGDILSVLIRLYFLKLYREDNQELINSIIDSLQPSLSFNELKIEFFMQLAKIHLVMKPHLFLFLINENIQYLLESHRESFINLKKSSSFLTLLKNHPQLRLVAEIFLKIPEKILMSDFDFQIHDKIIRYPQIDIFTQLLNTTLQKQQGIHSHELLSILEQNIPEYLMETLPSIPNNSSDFLFQLTQNARLRCLENLSNISPRIASYIDLNPLNDAHNLLSFVQELVSFNPTHINPEMAGYLEKYDFLNLFRLGMHFDLVDLENVYQVLGVSFPQKSYEALSSLLKTQYFQMHSHIVFKAIIHQNEPEHFAKIIHLFEDKELFIPPELLISLSKKDDIKSILDCMSLLFSESYYLPSHHHFHILEQVINAPKAYNLYSILVLLMPFQQQPHLESFISHLSMHEHTDNILELCKTSMMMRLLQDHQMHILLQMMSLTNFQEMAQTLCLIERKKLFSLLPNKKIESFINDLIEHPKQSFILHLIRQLLKMDAVSEQSCPNILQVFDCNLTDIDTFLRNYQVLNQQIFNKFCSRLFNFHELQKELQTFIRLGYIAEHDKKVQIRFFMMSSQLSLLDFIKKINKYSLAPEITTEQLVRIVLNHHQVGEIDKIFTLLEGFKIDFYSESFRENFLCLLESSSPFNAAYCYGNLFEAKILAKFDNVLLKKIIKNHPDLWSFGEHLSTYMNFYKSLDPAVAFELIYDLLETSKYRETIQYFKYLAAYSDISHSEIPRLVKKIRQHPDTHEYSAILQKLAKYKFLTIENLTHLVNIKSLKNILYFLTLLESNRIISPHHVSQFLKNTNPSHLAYYVSMLSHFNLLDMDNIDEILAEPHALLLATFLNHAKKTDILSQEFLNEFIEIKNHLFSCPQVRQRFLEIPITFISAVNLRQLIYITKHLKDDDIALSAELLRTCNQLLLNLNSPQNTHLASIHRTSSESAIRLKDRYQHLSINIRRAFNFLAKELLKLEKNLQNESAIRCLNHFTHSEYQQKIDEVSGVSLQQLLILCITGIQDEEIMQCPMEQRIQNLAEGLFEIQRGYNDMAEEEDAKICDGGAFNKLIQCMVGIHPDCQQLVITLNAASSKLPRLIIHLIKEHLMHLDIPETPEDLNKLDDLLNHIIQDNISVVWPFIEERVQQDLYEEFHELFSSPQDPKFMALIECGKELGLGEIKDFVIAHKNLINQQFHTRYLRFFENKNQDTQTQEAFDPLYGITMTKTPK